MVILKGLKTGKATIRLQISEKGYETVPPVEVEIHVIEHFEIFPRTDVFLMPFSVLRY